VTKLLVTHGHGDAMIMTSESHSRGHGDQAILHLSCNDFGKAFYIPWSKKLTPSGPLLFFAVPLVWHVPMQSAFGKCLLRPFTVLTRHKQCLHHRVELKKWCWIESAFCLLYFFAYQFL